MYSKEHLHPGPASPTRTAPLPSSSLCGVCNDAVPPALLTVCTRLRRRITARRSSRPLQRCTVLQDRFRAGATSEFQQTFLGEAARREASEGKLCPFPFPVLFPSRDERPPEGTTAEHRSRRERGAEQMFADLQQQQPGTSAAERESKAEPESPLQAEEAEEAEGSMVPWPARSSSSRCSAPANEAAQAEAALVPALPAYNYGLLNMECITNILRFVAEEDFAACLTVCRDWLLAGRDPALPFWRVLPAPPAPQTRLRRCGVVAAQRPRRLYAQERVGCPKVPAAVAKSQIALLLRVRQLPVQGDPAAACASAAAGLRAQRQIFLVRPTLRRSAAVKFLWR